jgi:hypothetical protein
MSICSNDSLALSLRPRYLATEANLLTPDVYFIGFKDPKSSNRFWEWFDGKSPITILWTLAEARLRTELKIGDHSYIEFELEVEIDHPTQRKEMRYLPRRTDLTIAKSILQDFDARRCLIQVVNFNIPFARPDDPSHIPPYLRNNIGVCFLLGSEEHHIQKNVQEAIRWFKSAAEANDPRAQYNYGTVLLPSEDAIHQYQLAADQHFPPAQTALGKCLLETQPDISIVLFREAALGLHPEAVYQFGICVENGYGMESSNPASAMEIYQVAGKMGNGPALMRYAHCMRYQIYKKVGVPGEIYDGIRALGEAASMEYPDGMYEFGIYEWETARREQNPKLFMMKHGIKLVKRAALMGHEVARQRVEYWKANPNLTY